LSVPVLSRPSFGSRKRCAPCENVVKRPPDAIRIARKIRGEIRQRRLRSSPRRRPEASSDRPVTSSRPGPTRHGPQSQSLSRSYGSNLPTSLTYIILSARGYSPWRPAADMGTNRRDICAYPSPEFSRSEGTIRTPPHRRCSSRRQPYLPSIGFHGATSAQAEKITLSESPVGVFRPFWVTPTNSLARERFI
jgi:hypothetical protein